MLLTQGNCITKTKRNNCLIIHDDVRTWKRFPHYWPFVRGCHRQLDDSPHKGPIMRMFILLSVWTSYYVWCLGKDGGLWDNLHNQYLYVRFCKHKGPVVLHIGGTYIISFQPTTAQLLNEICCHWPTSQWRHMIVMASQIIGNSTVFNCLFRLSTKKTVKCPMSRRRREGLWYFKVIQAFRKIL